MKRIITCITLIALIAIVCCFAVPSPVCSQEPPEATLERLLNQSGYTIVKKTSKVWTIDFNSTKSPPFRVIISVGSTPAPDIVVFVTVIQKKDFTASVESMYKLLKLTYELDKVKVMFDRDDDISVRIDSMLRITDLQALKEIIGQVARSSETIYVEMMPFLKTAR